MRHPATLICNVTHFGMIRWGSVERRDVIIWRLYTRQTNARQINMSRINHQYQMNMIRHHLENRNKNIIM